MEGSQRRLAAILVADMVGFSRLIGADEEGTIARQKALRDELVDPTIRNHHGRVVKSTGDGFLAEFGSAVDAVRCALRIQSAMQDGQIAAAGEPRIVYRIGINVGDIVIDGDDIFGDGVNIAARLENLADPGGICVSRGVVDHIRGKVDADFEDLGNRALKNIAEPMQVFRLRIDRPSVGPKPPVESRMHFHGEGRGRTQTPEPQSLPDKPSIAVLPFETAVSDQEWFSDGIAEDITTALTKSRRLLVVSKNYSFASKLRALRGDEIARELCVRYLLEGSVRLSGERVRVSTRLVEAATGALLWAERFDKELAEIFAIQDEITEAVVRHLELELLPDEKRAIQQARTESVESYYYELRGRRLALELTRSYLVLARRMFSKAAELDPLYARAYAGMVMCDCYLRDWHGEDIAADAILAIADKALHLDPALPEALAARGFALFCNERYEEAELAYRTALSIDPHSYDANFFSASTMARFLGDRERLIATFRLTSRLRPDDYVSPMMVTTFLAKDDPEKLKWARTCFERAERAADLHPENAAPLHRGAIALAYLGEKEKAHSWLARASEIDPDDFVMQYNAACVHSLFGNTEAAMQHLERAVRNVTQNTIDMIRNDPDFDAIRDHTRYPLLLRPRDS